MNNNWEDKFYRQLGVAVLIAFALIVISPFIFNSVYHSKIDAVELACQPYTSLGVDVKDNTLAFKNFIYTIKRKNGILVLGTSESDIHHIGNYQGFLNKYFDCGHKFSYLAGAGRSFHVYFPVFLNNKELFKGLKIIYFINPTYWRGGLNYFHLGYYDRYNNLKMVFEARDDMKEYGLYNEMGEPYVATFTKDSSEVFINAYFNDFRQFYVDLFGGDNQVNKGGNSGNSNLNCVQEIVEEGIDSSKIQDFLKEIILEENISYEYSKLNDSNFVQISSSDFQWKALKGFNEICKDLDIDVTYFLGPYNAIYCKNYNPEYQDQHEKLLVELKALLKEENANYIDGTGLSYIPGTFLDKQHHSEYGAWLIAEKIANYYEKNR